MSKASPFDRVPFDLPGRLPTGAFESEIKAADAGEETAEGRRFCFAMCLILILQGARGPMSIQQIALGFFLDACRREEG